MLLEGRCRFSVNRILSDEPYYVVRDASPVEPRLRPQRPRPARRRCGVETSSPPSRRRAGDPAPWPAGLHLSVCGGAMHAPDAGQGDSARLHRGGGGSPRQRRRAQRPRRGVQGLRPRPHPQARPLPLILSAPRTLSFHRLQSTQSHANPPSPLTNPPTPAHAAGSSSPARAGRAWSASERCSRTSLRTASPTSSRRRSRSRSTGGCSC